MLHKKRGRGRPATGHDPTTTIRLSPELRAKIDAWAAQQEDKPARSVAIRQLLEMALHRQRSSKETAKDTMARKRKDRWGDRISDLAFQQWMEILLRNTAKVEGEQVASEAARAILNINWPKQKVR